MDKNNEEKGIDKNILDEVTSGAKMVLNAYDRRNDEIFYVLKRLENLIALTNLSESDIPKDLIKNWIDETLAELLKMEGLDPEKVRGKSV